MFGCWVFSMIFLKITSLEIIIDPCSQFDISFSVISSSSAEAPKIICITLSVLLRSPLKLRLYFRRNACESSFTITRVTINIFSVIQTEGEISAEGILAHSTLGM